MRNQPLLLQAVTTGSGGGIESMVRSLAEDAAGRGWRSVVCYWRGVAPTGSTAEYVKLPSGRLPTWGPKLTLLVRRIRPSVIHLHGPTAGSLGALLAAIGSTAPIVYTEHAQHEHRPWLVRTLRHACNRVPRVNVAISAAVARSLIEGASVPSGKVRVIRNGVPFAPSMTRGVEPVITYVANLWRHKGHETLIRAVERVSDAMDLRVRLIGDGPERSSLEALARHLGVDKRIQFLGFSEDPWALADGSMAYVHPALHEGLGLAVMEAMMRGFPIIASGVGGIPEVLEHGETGLLVEPGDFGGISQAIVTLAEDEGLRHRLSAGARAHALLELTLERCLEAYFSLYGELWGVERGHA